MNLLWSPDQRYLAFAHDRTVLVFDRRSDAWTANLYVPPVEASQDAGPAGPVALSKNAKKRANRKNKAHQAKLQKTEDKDESKTDEQQQQQQAEDEEEEEKKKEHSEDTDDEEKPKGGASPPAERLSVVGVTFDPSSTHMFAIDSWKRLLIWKTSDWKLLSTASVNKRPTSVSASNSTVVVGDRYGDVYSYPIPSLEGDNCILGHLANVTSVLLVGASQRRTATATASKSPQKSPHKSPRKSPQKSPNKPAKSSEPSFLVSADRDDKIRVSHFPKAYDIQTFCLGHTAAVTCLCADESGHTLYSGAADQTVRVWNYLTGQALQTVDLSETVKAPGKWVVRGIVLNRSSSVLAVFVHGSSQVLLFQTKNNKLGPVHVVDMPSAVLSLQFHDRTTDDKKHDEELWVGLTEKPHLNILRWQNGKDLSQPEVLTSEEISSHFVITHPVGLKQLPDHLAPIEKRNVPLAQPTKTIRYIKKYK